MAKPSLLTKTLLLALTGATSLVSVVANAGREPEEELPQVVLLHGLGRTERSMWLLQWRLERAGYQVHAIGYPSRDESLDAIVDHVSEKIAECCGEQAPHFVTHSLGGIVVRAYAAKHGADAVKRVVMLSPPNHGSELVDFLGELAPALGPVGSKLGTGPESAPGLLNALGPVEFEAGVLAGDARLSPLGWVLVQGPNDGTVSVSSTRLPGMLDHRTLPASHTFIMNRQDVAEYAVHFFAHGRFPPHAPEWLEAD